MNFSFNYDMWQHACDLYCFCLKGWQLTCNTYWCNKLVTQLVVNCCLWQSWENWKKKTKQQLTTTYNNSNNKSIATFSLVLKRNLMQVKPLRLSLYSSVYEARPEQTLFSYNLSNRTLSGPWKVHWTPASSSKLKFITSTKSSTTGGLII